MNRATYAALQASIAKWDHNARASKPSDYRTLALDCALCRHSYYVEAGELCLACPVALATGKTHCHDTPYYGALFMARVWRERTSDDAAADHARAAARAEALFLRAIRPIGGPDED